LVSYTRLETNLARVKKDLAGVKHINNDFCSILEELNNIKEKSLADPKTMEKVSTEFRDKEIIDLFAGIEKDFNDLKLQLSKQTLYRERVADFVESLRTKKSFSFEQTTDAILFLEGAIATLDADHISINPQFIGTMDLGEVAIELGLHKTGQGFIVQKELFSEVLSVLIAKRMFKNIIFETNNAKIILRSSTELKIESDNSNIRKISQLTN
jgi:hypothetical protein